MGVGIGTFDRWVAESVDLIIYLVGLRGLAWGKSLRNLVWRLVCLWQLKSGDWDGSGKFDGEICRVYYYTMLCSVV